MAARLAVAATKARVVRLVAVLMEGGGMAVAVVFEGRRQEPLVDARDEAVAAVAALTGLAVVAVARVGAAGDCVMSEPSTDSHDCLASPPATRLLCPCTATRTVRTSH